MVVLCIKLFVVKTMILRRVSTFDPSNCVLNANLRLSLLACAKRYFVSSDPLCHSVYVTLKIYCMSIIGEFCQPTWNVFFGNTPLFFPVWWCKRH